MKYCTNQNQKLGHHLPGYHHYDGSRGSRGSLKSNNTPLSILPGFVEGENFDHLHEDDNASVTSLDSVNTATNRTVYDKEEGRPSSQNFGEEASVRAATPPGNTPYKPSPLNPAFIAKEGLE